jgi:dTDP-4-dehydrorhamnose 3,5-epimerase
MFEFVSTKIPGVKIITPRLAEDERGRFVKTHHRTIFLQNGLKTDFSETYYSVSRKNVLRGMHFQVPPHDHDKLVNCMSGEIIDVVLDLRVGSPSYADFLAFRIDGELPKGIYIPAGCAHGFVCVSDEAMVLYSVNTEYAPQHDAGICWNSFGFDWGHENLIISARDRALPSLIGFDSPFVF